MPAKKKLTKQQIKDKAAAAAKRITHGKIMDAFAFAGPPVRRVMIFGEDKNPENFAAGLIKDQSGINIHNGEFQLDGLKRGYSGPAFRKLEKIAFKAAGIKGPRSTIKSKGDVLDYLTYHGAAVGDAMQGHSPRDKFQRFYRSHFGHNLETNENEMFQVIVKKWAPYYIQKKVRAWLT